MSKCIVFTRASDGGVSVITPAYNDKIGGLAASGKSESDWLDDVAAKSVPADALNIHRCEKDDINPSRRFRNAWEQIGVSAPVTNMNEARVIRINEVRRDRESRFRELDIEYNRADETDDIERKLVIVEAKTKLRDLPETIKPDLDALTTENDLSEYEPEWPSVSK